MKVPLAHTLLSCCLCGLFSILTACSQQSTPAPTTPSQTVAVTAQAPTAPLAAETTAADPAPATSAPATSAPATNPPAHSQGATVPGSTITGVVIAASDVAGAPDAPLATQLVIAIPLELLGVLPGGIPGPPSDRDLRFLAVTVEAPEPQIATTFSDGQGHYTLPLAPGEYALCLADSDSAPSAAFPLTTRGCGRLAVQPGTPQQVDISSGFGEIVLVAR